ncbi:MAG TPA: HAMP domain-containing sensor histidine kinase [Candidatus Dormibacteraeota bacterium]
MVDAADSGRTEDTSDYLVAEGRAAGERVAQLCRWLFIALVAGFNNLGVVPTPGRNLINLILGGWTLVSAYVTVALLLRRRPGLAVSGFVTTVDLVLAAAIVYYSGGFDSPFFPALFLTVITSSVRLGVWAGLLSSVVIGLLYMTVGALAPHLVSTPEQVRTATIGRGFMVMVVGVSTALISRELLRERASALKAAAEAESLRDLAMNLASGLGRDEALAALLERVMVATSAAEASLFLQSGDELRRVGSFKPDGPALDSGVDPDLLKQLDGVQASDGGTVLLVPVQLEGAARAFLRLRSSSPFTARSRFQAGAVAGTVGAAVATSLKLQRQAEELDTLRGKARDLAAQDRRRTDVFSLVSHELRRPLAVLNVYSELLRRDLPEDQPEDAVRVMDTMAGSLREMDLLIDQLQMMARLDAGEPMPHPVPLDLEEQVEMAIRAVEPLATPNHQLSIASEGPVAVRADPQHVQLMLTNLLGNAIKYSPDGGAVVCEISRHGQSGVAAISDEGIGIAGADTTLLFKRFSRLPNAAASGAAGSGLGLYICKRLARLQGGNVSAEPRPERGSIFRLQLPLVRD